MTRRIPVILHTDIGGDIDDTWALAMMLRQPHLKPLMILTDTDNTVYRAALCEKMLEGTGFETEIEIGSGAMQFSPKHVETLYDWIKNYDMSTFPGRYYEHGIERMIELIMDSSVPITLISIGPCPSLAKALEIEPGIAQRCNFCGMFGSIRRNIGGQPGAIAEFNVKRDIHAFQKVLSAPWLSVTLTPLDTCGCISLRGELYRMIEQSKDPLIQKIVQSYQIWRRAIGADMTKECVESSILFDTVAVHLASSVEFLEMKTMNLSVTDDGFTVENDTKGRPVNVALDWKDLSGYERFLVNTLIG